MTEADRTTELAEIRQQLQRLAELQMMSARDVTQIRRRIEALADNLQANWDELEAVRADIERRLGSGS